MERKRVVIIGGGCAGLSAAYTLKKQGVDFVLLEAGPQTGGRVGNVQVGDYTYGIGAVMTEPQWTTTFNYLNELDLADKAHSVEKQVYGFLYKGKVHFLALGPDTKPMDLVRFRGMPYRAYFQAALFYLAIRKYVNGMTKGSHDFSTLSEVSNISTAAFGQQHGGAELVNRILSPFLGSMTLARANQVSVAHPIALLSLMKGMSYVDGGLGIITDSLYEQVKDHVRFSTPVKKVVIVNGAITGVETNDGFIEADEVICATDAVVACQIMPDLPPAIRKPLETCEYSTTYNYVFGLKKKVVPDHYMSFMIAKSEDSILSAIYDENSKAFGTRGPEGAGMMRVFTAGWKDAELKALSEEERTRRVIKEVQKFLPEFPDQPLFTDVIRWDRAVNLEAPGQYVAIQDMLQNHNRDVKGLYLSGEYLFLVACTEGALATGKEAAEQLVADRMQLAVR